MQIRKTLRALSLCRTLTLGGHVTVCKSCGVESISYNSCRNRHCPKCQVTNKERWIMDRESELLPVPYYHMVFTLPHYFNALLPEFDKEIYNALFSASWQTIQTFAADYKYLGAKTGMVSILHTWGNSFGCIHMSTVLFPEVVLVLPVNGKAANTTENTCSPKEL